MDLVLELSYHNRPIRPALEGDPLSYSTKQKIFSFVENYFCESISWMQKMLYCGSPKPSRKPLLSLIANPPMIRALSKTYQTEETAPTLERVREIFQEAHPSASLEYLQDVLKNPALEPSFDLTTDQKSAVYAARVFLKIAIRAVLSGKEEDSLELEYIRKLSHRLIPLLQDVSPSFPISRKHQLLMDNDPIGSLEDCPLTLSIVLTNTYFETPDGIEREKARELIRRELISLWENHDTRHVLDGLATVIHQEKGSILISKEERISSFLGNVVPPSGDIVTGQYNRHHSITLSTFFVEGAFSPKLARGTLCHEALHFICEHIYQNRSFPGKERSLEKRTLENYLRTDLDHRRRLLRSNPSSEEQARAIEVVSIRLESDYFGENSFDERNPEHLFLLGVEAIVRPMQLIAEGIPRAVVFSVAPRVLQFYESYTKPAIEARVKEVFSD